MKRICILLLFSLALVASLQAQTTVLVYGYVTNNAGVGQGNHVVTITEMGGNYTGTLLSGFNGYFSDSILVNTSQGGFTASIIDCNGSIEADSGFYSPVNNSVGALSLVTCRTAIGSCNAAFMASSSGAANNIFQFTDQSTGSSILTPVNNWSWDFGDGNSSTSQNPIHTYATGGNYTACLISSDGTCSDTTCQTLFVPTPQPCQAAFNFQVGINNQVVFIDRSSGGVAPYTYVWNFGDGTVNGTSSNSTHFYIATGSYTVCLYVTDATGCIDSTCQTVTINPTASCNASFTSSASGLGVQFTDASSGLSPNSTNNYSWDFGDGNSSTVQNPANTYAAGGTYTVCLLFSSTLAGVTCVDTTCSTITIQVNNNRAAITGQVFKNQIGADSVKVWLIAHDPVAGTLTAIDSTHTFGGIIGNGYYSFSNLAAGSYRTKAALIAGDVDYANYLPTYHDNDLMWNNATVITLGTNLAVIADINMVAGTNPGGPGFIGGLISQGANKAEGDPLENVHIYLLDNNDNAVAYVLTDAQGEYDFSNLAYGTYRVHVEILGRNYTDQYITISSASSAATNINFTVNSTDVDVTTALEGPKFGKLLSLYPNPTSGELYIELSLDKSVDLQIQVMDMLGRSHFVQQQQLVAGEQKLQLNLNTLSSGVYFLNLSVDNQIISHKVVVE